MVGTTVESTDQTPADVQTALKDHRPMVVLFFVAASSDDDRVRQALDTLKPKYPDVLFLSYEYSKPKAYGDLAQQFKVNYPPQASLHRRQWCRPERDLRVRRRGDPQSAHRERQPVVAPAVSGTTRGGPAVAGPPLFSSPIWTIDIVSQTLQETAAGRHRPRRRPHGERRTARPCAPTCALRGLVGRLAEASGRGEAGSARCGDQVRLDLAVAEGRITDARFQAYGCPAAIAAAAELTARLPGLSVLEAARLGDRGAPRRSGARAGQAGLLRGRGRCVAHRAGRPGAGRRGPGCPGTAAPIPGVCSWA